MEFVDSLISELISGERWELNLLFFVNVVLLLLARPIVNFISPNQDNKNKIKIFQGLNLLVIAFQVVDFALRRSLSGYEGGYLINLGVSLMAIYGGVFLYSICGTLSRKRFGRSRTLDDQTIYVETYNSRLVTIVLMSVIVLTVIYALIKIWGGDSLLGSTGIFGIFLALMAFTSSIWAPDIFSGMIILNSDILVDGDVVVIDGHEDEFIIARVTLIYVVLYDIRHNHRTLLRNTQFIQSRIDNLSRIASSDGIRQAYKYNIGYPELSADPELRQREFAEFKESIEDLFTRAFEMCLDKDNIKINQNKPFEWALTSAGDYALEYTMWVFLERIPNTKVTSTIRRHLMGTMFKVNAAVFEASVLEGVDLSTPDVINASVVTAQAPKKEKMRPVKPTRQEPKKLAVSEAQEKEAREKEQIAKEALEHEALENEELEALNAKLSDDVKEVVKSDPETPKPTKTS